MKIDTGAEMDDLKGDLILGIDASNVRTSGLLNYLIAIINDQFAAQSHFKKVIIWSCSSTLDLIHDHVKVRKETDPLLNRGRLHCLIWQKYKLSHAASQFKCDVLFVLGGHFHGQFEAYVVMHSNNVLLSFSEIWRWKSPNIFRLLVLRYWQLKTMQKASGVICLSSYARELLLGLVKRDLRSTLIIPHACDTQMTHIGQGRTNYQFRSGVCKLLYVSQLGAHKHHGTVVQAVSMLHKAGFSVQLDLVGEPHNPYLQQLTDIMTRLDPSGCFVKYYGHIPHSELPSIYAKADIFVFASSSEAQPIILNEAMASGLPIVCSNIRPMPDILQDAGLYFAPEDSTALFVGIKKLLESEELRSAKGRRAWDLSKDYSWKVCASKTFSFLAQTAVENRMKPFSL
jgi:glycosyltransferase involved in cell wall biosynthesis